MLLYLNKNTWADQGSWADQGAMLETDVRATNNFTQKRESLGESGRLSGSERESDPEGKIKILLLHECDEVKDGCEFGTFLRTTPQPLIDEGIFNDIAIALHTPPHRAVSLALVAQALGATKATAPSLLRPRSTNYLSASARGSRKSLTSSPSKASIVPLAGAPAPANAAPASYVASEEEDQIKEYNDDE